MKTEVKKLDATKCEINVNLSGEKVKDKFESIFAQIAKEAKVPGFRPGKAPRDVLEKHYAEAVHEQVLKELVPEIYNQAVEEQKLDVVELPQITDVKLDRSSLSFKATVELMPEIPLREYKKQKINYKKVSVSAEDIKRQIDSIKESRKADVVDDNFARSLGYPDVAELENAVQRQILMNKENQERARIENELIENIMKGLEFKVPQSMVDRQVEDNLRQVKIDLAMKGVSRDKIEEQEKMLLERISPDAKNQVKIYLVLSQIAKKENIPVDDHMTHKVIEFLLREADWTVE